MKIPDDPDTLENFTNRIQKVRRSRVSFIPLAGVNNEADFRHRLRWL
jgi:hypothetical protein